MAESAGPSQPPSVSSTAPAAASGNVVRPCAVAQVPEPTCGLRLSQRALRIGYQVQHTTAPAASSAPSSSCRGEPPRRARWRSSSWFTRAIPAASTTSEPASRPQASSRCARLDDTAITTGSVPMIIVGKGAPAIWIAAARNP